RRVVCGGLTAYTVVSVLIALTPWLTVFIALRFLQGFFTAIFIIVSRQIIYDLYEPDRQVAAIGTMVSGIILSPAVAPVAGAYIAHYLSWRFDFVLSAGFGAVLAVIGWLHLGESLASRLPWPTAGQLIDCYRFFFATGRVFWPITCLSAMFAAYFVFIVTSSFVYVDELGVNPRLYSKLFIFMALAYLAGNWTMKHLNGRGWQRLRLIFWGLMMATAGCAVGFASLIDCPALIRGIILAVASAMVRAGYAFVQPPLQVVLMRDCGGQRLGAMLGVLYLLQFGVSGVVSQLAATARTTALNITVLTMAAMLAVALISYLLWRRTGASSGYGREDRDPGGADNLLGH
ncbi:MAG: MFS transporter, partial [Negativicutes bacterium]|nr:MFS transporter [Negativicutes bacterium]